MEISGLHSNCYKIKGNHGWIMSQESMFADGFSETKYLTFYEVFEKNSLELLNFKYLYLLKLKDKKMLHIDGSCSKILITNCLPERLRQTRQGLSCLLF